MSSSSTAVDLGQPSVPHTSQLVSSHSDGNRKYSLVCVQSPETHANALQCGACAVRAPFLIGPNLDSSQAPRPTEPTGEHTESPTANVDSIPTSNKTSSLAALNPAGAPKQKRSFLNIPSRSSSNNKQEPASTQPVPSNANMVDDARNPGKGPRRRSLLSRPRNGSQASSRKSLRVKKEAEGTRQPVPSIPQADGAAGTSEKKGRSGFLSFLNCCGGPDGANATDMDDPVLPPKKATKLQPVVRRPSRTVEKAGTVGIEANDVEKRETYDEKTPAVGDGGESSVMNEKLPTNDLRPRIPRTESSHDKVLPILATGSQANPSTQSDTTPGQPEPVSQEPLPTSDRPNYEQGPKPQVSVQAPTPVEPVGVGQNRDWPSSDDKRDSDVEMVDAPPEEPEEEHQEVAEPVIPEPQPARVDLPPPPPLIKRESQLAGKETPPVPASSSEKQTWLLPPVQPRLHGRKCLVLDLDETLVHSSFKILNQADFTIPVEIEGQYHNVYVIKRPGVDAFMKRVGELYEVVVFTASVSKYGDPLLDQLDIHKVVHHRLFRESCYNHQGNYVKVSE